VYRYDTESDITGICLLSTVMMQTVPYFISWPAVLVWISDCLTALLLEEEFWLLHERICRFSVGWHYYQWWIAFQVHCFTCASPGWSCSSHWKANIGSSTQAVLYMLEWLAHSSFFCQLFLSVWVILEDSCCSVLLKVTWMLSNPDFWVIKLRIWGH